jgi:hypothetical protein
MGTNNRDWYRDWWRKKSGYTERAAFRLGHSEHKQAQQALRRAARSSAWRRNIWLFVGVLLAFAAIAMFR